MDKQKPKTDAGQPACEHTGGEGSVRGRLDKATIFKFVGLLGFFALMIAVCVAVAPLLFQITEPGGLEKVITEVRSAGAAGVFVLLGIQLLQVMVAFIPGEVVQVAAGMMYGPWAGAAIVIVGCVISSAFIFFMVHKLGAPFVRAMIPAKWMDKLEAFEQTDKLDVMVFVLFLIPGVPKDVITYLVPLTQMRLSKFVVIANIGRIPGIMMSTLAADGLIEGDYLKSIVLFLICATIAVIAILSYEKLLKLFARRGEGEE